MNGEDASSGFQRVCFLILFAIIIFHVVNNVVILKSNQAYPYHNMGRLVKNSQTVYYLLKGNYDTESFEHFNYPLAFFAVSAFFYLIFGFSLFVAIMTNMIFLIILMLSVYGIGSRLHSKMAGLLAAFVVSFFPVIFGFSRIYTLDFALACATSLCVYCLLRTEHFTSRRYSLLFGLSAGFAAAIKPSFFVYAAGPFLTYVCPCFVFKHAIDGKRWVLIKMKNILLSLVLGFLFALVWYFPAWGNIFSQARFSISMGLGGSNFLGAISDMFYLKLMAGTQILVFFFLLFLFAVGSFIFYSGKKRLLVFLWFLVPLLFYTFFLPLNRGGRFTVPVVPAVALMVSMSVLDIRNKLARGVIVVLIVLISFGQFFLVSYLPENYFIIKGINEKLGLGGYPNVYFVQEKYGMFPPYTAETGLFHAIREDWGVGESIRIILDKLGDDNSRSVEVETFNQVVSMPLKYFFEINGYNNVKIKDSERTPPDEPPGNPDFVILTNMSKMRDVTGGDCLVNINAAIKKFEGRTDYKIVRTLILPDDTIMYIYERAGK